MGNEAGFRIRTATEADRAAIQEVSVAAYIQYAEIMPQDIWESYKENILEVTANIGGPAEQIVAEMDGAIVGSVLIFPSGSTMGEGDDEVFRRKWPEIRLLAVAPLARGKGIGAALTKECIRRARESGVATITLHTLDMMPVAMRMYEKLGFVRMPELDFHPGPEVVVKGYSYDLQA
ncbi:MAG: GNAT family N-acetyltransferase [Chloroflexota bacterium]